MDEQKVFSSDYRVVFLYSQERQTGVQESDLVGKMASYYDEISVLPIPSNSLSSAYEEACKLTQKTLEKVSNVSNAKFPQTMIVFTDIQKELNETETFYTSKQLESFWNKNDYKIFSMTMVHLGNNQNLKVVFQKAKETFPFENFLVYLSFDYSDLIIFGKTNSFRICEENMFKFDYSENDTVTDSITLWSFGPTADQKESHPQTFTAHFRFGTSSYAYAKEFIEHKKNENCEVTDYCLLGRNDIAVVNSKATIFWLYKMREELHDKKWCTTYDVCVLLPPLDKSKMDGYASPALDEPTVCKTCDLKDGCSKRESYQESLSCKSNKCIEKNSYLEQDPSFIYRVSRKAILSRFEEFKTAYINGCTRMEVEPDFVWLRWLHETTLLASSFLSNKMSRSIGLFLMPQIRDILIYGKSIFSSEKLRISHKGEIETKFFKDVFSNILVLIDSMNHSNRQFVQTPSFHIASFEMQPKVMAYYTAITQELIDTLKDDEDAPFYGYTISPGFTNALKVKSLALQEICPKDEFISIEVDEKSLYDIRLTTETLAHELSHYVGGECRNRLKRMEFILSSCFCTIIQSVLKEVCHIIAPTYTADLSSLSIFESSCKLTSAYINEKVDSSQVQYLDYLWENHIKKLGKHINQSPSLDTCFFNQVKSSLEQTHFTSTINGENKPFVELLNDYLLKTMGIKPILDIDSTSWADNPIVYSECDRIFKEALYSYMHSKTAKDGKEVESSVANKDLHPLWHSCYLFKETFADLQMIQIFDMSWREYYQVLDLSHSYNRDTRQRALAVATTLHRHHEPKWKNITALEDACDEEKKIIEQINKFLETEYPLMNAEQFEPFVGNVTIQYWLVKYLDVCYCSINKQKEEKKERLETLTACHNTLSSTSSLLDIHCAILELNQTYQDKMLQSCREYLDERNSNRIPKLTENI